MKLINADKVIEKLKEHKSLFCKNRDEFRALSDKDKARVDEIDTCIAELVNAEEFPTTEPDADTISRAKAIEAINKALDRQTLLNRFVRKVAIDAIKQLPPAQPAQPERIKGHWIEYIPEHGKCPFCGNQVDLLGGKANNFCGECGADMR